jgi:ParB-like chromosome segregation protein Spo0J
MNIDVKLIKPNKSNPRLIKNDKYKKLVKSIKDFPEMLEVRQIVLNKENVILGGNMRYKAALELGIKELPVKIVDWSRQKQDQFVIKDNASYGDWDFDSLANQFDMLDMLEWGVDLPSFDEKELKEKQVVDDPFADDNEVVCPKCSYSFEKTK